MAPLPPVIMAIGRIVAFIAAAFGFSGLSGCSDSSDFQRHGERWTYLGKPLEGADAKTVRVLDAHHAKDLRQVWFADTERRGQEYYLVKHVVVRVIVGADADSFAVLGDGYARDRAAVFHDGRRLAVADVPSFEPLSYGFTRDKRQAYYLDEPIAGSLGASFQVLDSRHADDGRHIFHADLQRSGDEPRVRAIAGVDRASFQLLEAGWSRDAKSLFHDGRRVPGDPGSFQALDRGYVRTADRVFYMGVPVKGADAASFEMLQPDSERDADARDRHRFYARGQAASAASTGGSSAGSAASGTPRGPAGPSR